ncbi:hypothetical protein Q3G72_017460 [Acer saccharum]|nr:hypothetical protein Q3G72_017460 [Acer saccharum]
MGKRPDYEDYGECGRVGHRRDSCVEVGVSCNEGESVSVAKPNLCDPKTFPSLNGAKIDSFGLWKQVAYGRNGRNAGGSNFGGKKPGNVDTLGKSNSTTKVGSGPSSYGVESFGKGMGNRRMMERVPAVVSGQKVVYPSKNGKPGISVIEGSRFAVLSDDVVDNTSSNKVLNKSMDKGKGISNSVLSEISNRVLSRKKKTSLSPNKYLQNAGTDYCRTTILLKENICGEGIQVCNEGSSGVVEDLEDSDILRSLHLSVMDSVMLFADHAITNVGCGTSDLGGSSDAANGIGLQVDVSATLDLDIVASDLREAMEVALE